MSINAEAEYHLPRRVLADIVVVSGLDSDQVRTDYALPPTNTDTCLALRATLGELVAFVAAAETVLRDDPHTAPAADLLTRIHHNPLADGTTIYFWPLLKSIPPQN